MTPDEAGKLERERRDADARYNEALTALDRAIISLDGRDLSRDDVGRVGSALLCFLQQITAFVETKDRQLAADDAVRGDTLAHALRSVDELKTQTAVLRRSVESFMGRERGIGAETQVVVSSPPQSAIRNPQSVHDFTYVAFEDQFRGSDAAIEDRLRAYVPIFSGCADVLDIGCGRGELLAALRAAGVAARGIDAN